MDITNWTQVDEAIQDGRSSIDIWSRTGRQLGISLEMIVLRRRSLRGNRRRRAHPANVLPLFASIVPSPLVANG